MLLSGAFGTYALYNIFGFFDNEAFGKGHLGDSDIGQTEGVVAVGASQVYVTHAVAGVVMVADTVFLRAAAVVDIVEQVAVAQERQCTEQGAAVYGGQRLLQVVETEYAIETVTYLFPYHQSHRSDADAGMV